MPYFKNDSTVYPTLYWDNDHENLGLHERQEFEIQHQVEDDRIEISVTQRKYTWNTFASIDVPLDEVPELITFLQQVVERHDAKRQGKEQEQKPG